MTETPVSPGRDETGNPGALQVALSPMRWWTVAIKVAGWLIVGALVAVLFHGLWGPISARLLLARPCPPSQMCHQTWTLTARLGQVLETYEARLGPRDDRYRLLGIEFTAEPRPGIRFPDFGTGQRAVIVQLTQGAASDRELALFQLAHEAFHIMAPTKPSEPISYLEEGLASYLAIDFLKQQEIATNPAWLSEPAYVQSFELVTTVARQYPDFYARLTRLRQETKSFSQVTSEQLQAVFPTLEDDQARKLVKPFQ